jgi:hypothetical protein
MCRISLWVCVVILGECRKSFKTVGGIFCRQPCSATPAPLRGIYEWLGVRRPAPVSIASTFERRTATREFAATAAAENLSDCITHTSGLWIQRRVLDCRGAVFGGGAHDGGFVGIKAAVAEISGASGEGVGGDAAARVWFSWRVLQGVVD